MIQKKFIKDTEVKSYFGNLDELITTHSLFLARLLESYDHFPLIHVGALIYEQTPSFFIYISFCNRYNECLDKINELKKNSRDFTTFLSEQAKNVPGGHGIQSLFVQPVQRLPRYSLLLKEMIKHTTEDHVDFYNFISAKEKIDKILETVNDTKRKYEIANAMLRVQQYLSEIDAFKIDFTTYLLEDLATIQFSKVGSKLPADEKDCLLFFFKNIWLIFEVTKKPKRLSFALIQGKNGTSRKVYYDKPNDVHIHFKHYFYMSSTEVTKFQKKVIGLKCIDFDTNEAILMDIQIQEKPGANRSSIWHENFLNYIDEAEKNQDQFHINNSVLL